MLKDILEFFRREKIYAVLCILLAGFFIYMAVWNRPEANENSSSSQAVEHFRQAEDAMHKKLKEAGSLGEFLKDRPVLDASVRFFSLLASGAFILGLILDCYLFFLPESRRRLKYEAPPPKVNWKFSMVFKVIVLFVSAGIGLSLFFNFFRSVFLRGAGDENFFLLLHTTLMDMLCFVFIAVIVKRSKGSLRDLGLKIPKGSSLIREIGFGLGGYIAIIPLFVLALSLLVLLAYVFHYEPPSHPLVGVLLEEETRSPWLIVYSVLLATVIGPIFEEIFFRGFFYPVVKKYLGLFWAMIITSIFFALIHENSFAFFPIFILGMGLNYLYEKRSSLAASITLHITHNSLFLAYFFIAKQVVTGHGGS